MYSGPVSDWSLAATAAGIAAPPPPSRRRLDRSRLSMPGIDSRPLAIVVMQVHELVFIDSISSAAASRSQRWIITIVAPTRIGAFMFDCMPVTWNSGSVARITGASPQSFQRRCSRGT